jgi:V/A-type H+-transporting ATPase subunit E
MERMVTQRLEDSEFLERLLLTIAGRAVPRDKPIEVLLPEAMSLTSADMEHAHHAEVDAFVRGLTGDMLREGVTISVSSDHEAGLVVRVREEGLEVRLDDRSLSQLLGQHLLPRFRALLDGDSAGMERRNDRE